jgi:flagellar biosynthesis anti-sigma factor FlgM
VQEQEAMQVHNAASSMVARTYGRQVGGPGDAGARPISRSAEGRPRTDSLAISDSTRELARLRQAAAEQPDVRAGRVAALKNAIESGTYQMDLDVLAAKLLG